MAINRESAAGSRLKPRLRTYSLRVALVALTLTALAPMLAFASFMVIHSANLEREATRRHLIDTARALTLTLDRDLAGKEGVLATLSRSVPLQNGDLAGFYEQAQRAGQTANGWIVLQDSARRILDTRVPPNASPSAPLPMPPGGRPDTLIVSDLIHDGTLGYVTSISEPVRVGDHTATLALVLPASLFTNLLITQGMPPDWIARFFDRQGVTSPAPAPQTTSWAVEVCRPPLRRCRPGALAGLQAPRARACWSTTPSIAPS